MKNLNIFSSVANYENTKSMGTLNVPNVSFIDEDNSTRYLLENIDPYNGYKYVNLGLPSGLKWATCNIGAASPEEYGLYFAWGETTGYTTEQITSGVRAFTQNEYNAGPAASMSANLTLEQDAAHVNMGGNWRMPSKADYQELVNNTTQTIISNYNKTGVNGYLFTSKINSNSIFLPLVGWAINSSISFYGSAYSYWTIAYSTNDKAYLYMGDTYASIISTINRYYGIPIRAVSK